MWFHRRMTSFYFCGRPLSGNYRPTAEADEWAVERRLCKAAQHR